jgi:4-amino-4-deoxy-L-arabinose transferase-like glycosyltransferase
VLGIALLGQAPLLLTAVSYGYHRDELYFLVAGQHPAWGYVDQPPITPMLARLADTIAPGSLFVLRLVPALTLFLTVVVTALLARELGAGRRGQIGAAVVVAFSPGFLLAGHLLSTATLDVLVWAVTTLLVLRIVRTKEAHWWLAVGAVLGVGLENKWTPGILVIGLLVGLLATPQRKILASGWFVLGVAIALALWAPNLLWQASHDWPQIDMVRGLQQGNSDLSGLVTWLPYQLLIVGPLATPFVIAAFVGFLRGSGLEPYRFLAIAYVVLAVVLAVAVPDKQYYLAGLYPALIGAGGPAFERWLDGHAHRASLVWVPAILTLLTLVLLPGALPIVPVSDLQSSGFSGLNGELGEQVGWPSLTAAVARVWRALPPEERAHAVIFTSNYGEAGAIERFGSALGLPLPYSGHNSYWWWRRPPASTTTWILVGTDPCCSGTYYRPFFASLTMAATITNPWGVENDEEGLQVWVARKPKMPVAQMWPRLRHYD